MARLLPSDVTTAPLSFGESAELRTLNLLRRKLPADYTVYHSVHWSLSTSGHAMFGEVDFVVVNRSGAVVIVELKAGQLEETPAGLAKRYEGLELKSVAPQVHRNQDGLRKQFARQTGGQLMIDYLFYCPDHHVRTRLGSALAADRIVDAGEGQNLPKRIMALLPRGADSKEGERVHRFFENLFHLVPDIHAHAAGGDRVIAAIPGGGLAGIVTGFDMAPMRLRVRGPAGSGKSVAALACVRKEVERGRRPLLVCFNRPLAEKLSTVAPPEATVTTFHGLLDRFLTSCGQAIDFTKVGEPGFWAGIQERVILETVPETWRFDTLVVDEGQDFDADWLDILLLFLREAPAIYWFEDEDQDIRHRAARDARVEQQFRELGFAGFRTRCNYRTPRSIAAFINEALPEFAFEALSPLPGLGVGVHRREPGEDLARRTGAIVTDLMKHGFRGEDIVALSLRGLGSASLSGLGKIGAHSLARPTGAYGADGRQVMGEGLIRFDTVHRFKGQEACAVVVTDVPGDFRDLPPGSSIRRALLVALTRAKIRADLICEPSAG